MSSPPPQQHDVAEDVLTGYWRRNVQLVVGLLGIWAFVSFGCGILFAPWLDQFNLPFTAYPLGFWFAQQGSIIAFVLLVFTYVFVMNRIEHDEGLDT